MNIYVTRPVNPMFNCAVQTITKRVWPQWFDTSAQPIHNSFKLLKAEHAARGRITVYSGDCDTSIFDDPDINVMFRAWHDWCHIQGDHDFTVGGEMQAAYMQMQHVITLYGDGETGREFCRLIDAEVIGQAMYYHKHKKYVKDQRTFVAMYLLNPHETLRQEW